jgi:hypothetical protein
MHDVYVARRSEQLAGLLFDISARAVVMISDPAYLGAVLPSPMYFAVWVVE